MPIFTTLPYSISLDEKAPAPRLIPHVFCDMDGVVANFYAGMEHYIGVPRDRVDKFLTQQDGWKRIAKKQPHLFAKLPLLHDARALMNALAQLRDDNHIRLSMLTAIPDEWYNDPVMRRVGTQDKINWVGRYFQRIPPKNVLVVRRKDKASYVKGQLSIDRPRPILIDDFAKNIREWEAAGGIGIRHTDTLSSLRHLVALLNVS